MLAFLLAFAAQAGPQSTGLDALCAGWAGKWRAEIDLTHVAGRGWSPSGDPADWGVEATAPGRCTFSFGGKAQFAIDTTKGGYEAIFFKDGRSSGPARPGRIVFSEISGPKAWNIVVETQAEAGPYRMQMTMAGDIFAIYLTEPGQDLSRAQPHAFALHRRVVEQ